MAKPWVVGHRGARYVVKENTLQAFRYALEHGADAVECDVWKARDGSLVVTHDREIEVARRKYDVKSLTLRQIKSMKPTIPTLKEVLALVVEGYKKHLFVELKDPSAWEKLDEELEGWDNVTVISFYAPQLKKMRYPSKGLLFVLRPLSLKNVIEGMDLEWIAPRRDMVDQELLQEARDLNLKVLTWLHNRPKEVREALRWGVDAFATDRPDLAIRWMNKGLEEWIK
ncbi:glycerophosphoryl diester phosphodiesterase [Ignicoccus pacificus DSM 13166]|uniref:Glycerophosphoryl diester phosphodiesterase n=1 Tax=Ignicoccus pacificus DSM 13166 TaxID=940294 RepID=A0A977PKH0_9CREN|nr:glycerophosphoryl diester phosphodiesterase [Ignicoccus pacificus DSM 13166]